MRFSAIFVIAILAAGSSRSFREFGPQRAEKEEVNDGRDTAGDRHVLLCLCARADAANELAPYEEYEKKIKAAQVVGPLKDDILSWSSRGVKS
ncbi:hypothetical protein [Xanthomonas sp. WHRI 7945]|nr:hypothetical protein [Xanthomonas campestris pv. campestris]